MNARTHADAQTSPIRGGLARDRVGWVDLPPTAPADAVKGDKLDVLEQLVPITVVDSQWAIGLQDNLGG